ncbi:MAG: hypothetical protein JWM20_700 [Patescibacteria group bacterium]|nr:hypothetical protein [Patescibacteria group bacterium]
MKEKEPKISNERNPIEDTSNTELVAVTKKLDGSIANLDREKTDLYEEFNMPGFNEGLPE